MLVKGIFSDTHATFLVHKGDIVPCVFSLLSYKVEDMSPELMYPCFICQVSKFLMELCSLCRAFLPKIPCSTSRAFSISGCFWINR